ncbi:MAG: response regulator [Chloroflexota bacterium]
MAILHLEDDLMLTEIFAEAIEALDESISIVHFAKGTDVLDYMENPTETISVCFFDIRVRGTVDGLEVAKQLREKGFDKPIFMSSAYEKPESNVMESLNLGWIPKPWQITDLAKQILPLA